MKKIILTAAVFFLCFYASFHIMNLVDDVRGRSKPKVASTVAMVDSLQTSDTEKEQALLPVVAQRVALAAPPDPATVQPFAREPELERITPLQEALDTIAELRAEIQEMKAVSHAHRMCLSVGPVGKWVKTLYERDIRPDAKHLEELGWFIDDLKGVVLTREEGLYILERECNDDWEAGGTSYTEAIVAFLGYNRLARELTPEALIELDMQLE